MSESPRSGGKRASSRSAFGSRRLLEFAGILLLALLSLGRSALGTQLDGVTIDEPWHLVAGVEYVRTGDFRLNPEHPPLAKLWVGAAMPSSFELRAKASLAEKSAERDLVEETFFCDNDFLAAQQRARWAMWTFHGLLLVVIGWLLRATFGFAWAVGSLAFLVLEPTFGAHLPVVMTDLPLALTLFLAALCAGRLILSWRWPWVLVFGFSAGLALGAKHSALPGVAGIFVVVSAFVLLQSRGRELLARVLKLALAALLALGLLWALYGFHFHAGPDGSDGFNRAMPDKVSDLQVPFWRRSIELADHWRLLPRSYLWGLADTVRAGVEGRGQNLHFLWGRSVKGAPPWYTWPSYVVIKVPLALLALSLVGASALWRARLPAAARLTLWVVFGMALAHFFALAGSQGSYAGIRHALPLLMVLALVPGAATSRAWQERSRLWGIAVVSLLLVTALMTLGEKRLWEYHNELVGGSAGAWHYFRNESLDLGQRSLELKRFYDAEIASTGKNVYSDYWLAEEQARALEFHLARRVTSLEDTNVAGVFEGFFFYPAAARLPQPEFDFDPRKVFAGMVPVARFGLVEVWRGRQVSPQARASSLRRKVLEYIYREQGSDWALVSRRLEEVLAATPYDFSVAIELGNAYLRLGQRSAALRAYRQPFSQGARGVLDDMTRENLAQRLASLEHGEALATLKPLRNPWME